MQNKIENILKLTSIPFHRYSSFHSKLLLPEINEILINSIESSVVIFGINHTIFYASIRLTENNHLIIGPLASARFNNLNPTKVFSYLKTTEDYLHIKTQINNGPLTNQKKFIKLVKTLYKLEFEHECNPKFFNINVKADQCVSFNSSLISFNLRKKIISAIKHGQKETIVNILRDPNLNFSNSIFKTKISKKNLQYFFFGSLNHLASIAKKAGVNAAICNKTVDQYINLWNKNNYSTIETSHLIVRAILEFTDHCQRTIFLNQHDAIMNQIICYIADNIDKKISRKDIAQALNLSPSYLSHHVKEITNKSITELINKYKVNQAQYLLETSNTSIIEISEMLGYTNVSYFNRVFAKLTNKTPSEYRKMQ